MGAEAVPLRTALSFKADASEPACGSVSAKAPISAAGEHLGQPARLLFIGAPGDQRVLGQDVDRQRDGQGHVGVGDLLHDQRPRAVGEAGAADLRRERHGRQTELAHAIEEGAVVALLLVARRGAGCHLAPREVAHGLLEESLLVGQAARSD